jgi:hypothetical protein
MGGEDTRVEFLAILRLGGRPSQPRARQLWVTPPAFQSDESHCASMLESWCTRCSSSSPEFSSSSSRAAAPSFSHPQSSTVLCCPSFPNPSSRSLAISLHPSPTLSDRPRVTRASNHSNRASPRRGTIRDLSNSSHLQLPGQPTRPNLSKRYRPWAPLTSLKPVQFIHPSTYPLRHFTSTS